MVEAVVRVQANATNGELWAKGGGAGAGGFFLGVRPGSQIAGYAFEPNSATAAAPFSADNAFHMVGIRRIGTNIEVRVDGQPTSSALTSADDASESGQPLYIGVGLPQYASITKFVGDVAELVAVHGTTSNANVGKLEAYFKEKYAL